MIDVYSMSSCFTCVCSSFLNDWKHNSEGQMNMSLQEFIK